MNLKDEALRFLKAGVSIIPIRAKEKTPLVRWKEYQERLATEAEILDWWEAWPDANIGIVCGKINGITVVDCDSEEAIETMEKELSESPPGGVVQTPRGGRHYYLPYQPELKTCAKLLPGVDVRNDGGYVVAPPSKTKFGCYKWIRQWK